MYTYVMNPAVEPSILRFLNDQQQVISVTDRTLLQLIIKQKGKKPDKSARETSCRRKSERTKEHNN